MKKLDFSSDFLSVIRGLVGMLFQHHQTKQNALKSKNDKIFKKMTKKKKRFYAIMLQIHSKYPMNA
ncbi:hypothetical protein JP0022_05930 [Helicobacter pylori]